MPKRAGSSGWDRGRGLVFRMGGGGAVPLRDAHLGRRRRHSGRLLPPEERQLHRAPHSPQSRDDASAPMMRLKNLFLSFSEKSIRRTPRCELMFFFFFSKAMRTSRGKCGCWRPLASASLAAPLPPISSALVKRYTTHKSEEFLVLYIFSTII